VCLIVLAGSCGGDDDEEPAATSDVGTEAPAEGTGPAEFDQEVQMVNIAFEPAEIDVPVGGVVVWVNGDGVDHTTTADEGQWDSGVVASGESFEFTFDEPGTYTYTCLIHAQMQGSVVVGG
jgi:plastocyanin